MIERSQETGLGALFRHTNPQIYTASHDRNAYPWLRRWVNLIRHVFETDPVDLQKLRRQNARRVLHHRAQHHPADLDHLQNRNSRALLFRLPPPSLRRA